MKRQLFPIQERSQRWSRWLKRLSPRTLYGRTLAIIVIPVLISQAVATFVYFDRHWSTVTHRLTYAVAGDIGYLVAKLETVPDTQEFERIQTQAARKLDLELDLQPSGELPKIKRFWPSPIKEMLKLALKDRLTQSFTIDRTVAREFVAVYVKLDNGSLLTVRFPERRVYTPTTEVFITWMIGSSIVLSVIALMFMRNQIRPIRRLAAAAEEFGKGRDVEGFKPEGAIEVRQAAAALLLMRDRLRRQVTQRMAMLSGVSHDLRTPLTRMKLQLAMMPQTPDSDELKTDIAEMEAMVEAYLAFARGEEAEAVTVVDLEGLLQEVMAHVQRQNPRAEISLFMPQAVMQAMRRQAMKRCFGNLIGNAVKYAAKVQISVIKQTRVVEVLIDDNGPGIPPERRDEVFRPFVRLDEERPTTGSVGLGLTIARDIARYHGGDVALEDSPLGGLRARLWLPL